MAYVQEFPIGVGALYDENNPMYAIMRARKLDAHNKAEAESMRHLEKAQAKAKAQAQAKADAMAEAANKAVEKDRAKELLKGMADAKVLANADAREAAREAAREVEMAARKAAREAMEAAVEQDKKDAALRKKKQLNLLIENSVKIPEEFLESNIKSGSIQDAEKYLTNMIEDLHQVKKLEDVHVHVHVVDAESHGLKEHEHDGFYLLDMRNLRSNKPSWGLEPFKLKYERHIKPSQIVFIRVIRFSDTRIRLGSGESENVRTIMFNAYFPNADPIICMREIGHEGKQGQYRSEPTQCVFELPVGVVLDYFKLYKPDPKYQINPHNNKDPSSLDDLMSATPDAQTQSKIVEPRGFKPLFDRLNPAASGGKLRSAKKTSKRRSVKSKPRYYRRSVGGINHRRKKTTRRRK